MDRRLTASNGRVAASHLQGRVEADVFVEGAGAQVIVPLTDICKSPDGPRDRQRLLGAVVTVFEDRNGWSFVQADDGYVGYVRSTDLGRKAAPTHRVATFGTHAYTEPDFKAPAQVALPFDARLHVVDERPKFFETDQGFVPKKHLRPLDRPFSDPVTLAQLHFQTPYLWGGNSTRGIDCSGLVQAAFTGCDIACPGDSDMQLDRFGAQVSGPYERGDLLFWKGHVGMMVDRDVMIHANAHHMAVAYEPITAAITRIAAQGDGPVLAHKRL